MCVGDCRHVFSVFARLQSSNQSQRRIGGGGGGEWPSSIIDETSTPQNLHRLR